MATFGDVTYFLKVGQQPAKCENVCYIMTNSVPDCALITDLKKLAQKVNCNKTATFGGVTYFLKVGRQPTKCKNVCYI